MPGTWQSVKKIVLLAIMGSTFVVARRVVTSTLVEIQSLYGEPAKNIADLSLCGYHILLHRSITFVIREADRKRYTLKKISHFPKTARLFSMVISLWHLFTRDTDRCLCHDSFDANCFSVIAYRKIHRPQLNRLEASDVHMTLSTKDASVNVIEAASRPKSGRRGTFR